jgi:hypothetical protein
MRTVLVNDSKIKLWIEKSSVFTKFLHDASNVQNYNLKPLQRGQLFKKKKLKLIKYSICPSPPIALRVLILSSRK